MTKVIFNITAAIASLMGQLYDAESKVTSETTQKISIEAPSDSISIHLKPEIKKALFPTKRNLQAS